MVAKINHTESLYGTVAYNLQKVDDGTARVIGGHRMIADVMENPQRTMRLTLLSFENHLAANRNTEKPILHISLNPAPDDKLTDEQYSALAEDYMERMGYGNQPWIAYLHEDTGRKHVHIVSVCTDEDGVKIDDSYEWRRSVKACRELEQRYGLQKVEDKKSELTQVYLKKADPAQGNVKHQISNILKSAIADYRFQSFGEWSALLSCFNIEAKPVKGEFNGVPYNGVVYFITDGKGNAVSVPVKSSRIGKAFGHEGLNRRMERNAGDFKSGKWQPKIGAEITLALKNCAGSRERFIAALRDKGIDVVFRENEQGRIYGATFIDHRSREVCNGSRLGKEFSANVFNGVFNEGTASAQSRSGELRESSNTGTRQSADRREGKSVSVADTIGDAVGETLGLLSPDPDPYDQRDEAATRKKKKKKKRYYGRQI